MVSPAFTIPKAFGFEDATQPKDENLDRVLGIATGSFLDTTLCFLLLR
jgi:hypothetical protein